MEYRGCVMTAVCSDDIEREREREREREYGERGEGTRRGGEVRMSGERGER